MQIEKLVILDWPVLSRVTSDTGKMLRSKRAYVRTKAPRSEREVDLVGVHSPHRIEIYFGLGETMIFSLRTGRSLGRPDWVIREDHLTALRTEMKEYVKAILHMEQAIRFWMTGALEVPEPATTEEEPDDAVMRAVAAAPANDVAGK